MLDADWSKLTVVSFMQIRPSFKQVTEQRKTVLERRTSALHKCAISLHQQNVSSNLNTFRATMCGDSSALSGRNVLCYQFSLDIIGYLLKPIFLGTFSIFINLILRLGVVNAKFSLISVLPR